MDTAQPGDIQTVLGPIAKDQLGITDAHEHLIRDGGALVDIDADFLLDNVAAAQAELKMFRAVDGRAIVDMTPTAPGRNPELVRELSRQTGVHVIATTGFVDWALGPESPVWQITETALADALASEVCVGMDAGNYSGAVVRRTSIRAGVIKISLEHDVPTERELCFIEAVATAHRMTGAPIVVHTDRGKGTLGLLSLLAKLGVESSAVILSHVFHARDYGLVESLVRQGAFVVADGVGKPQHSESKIIDDVRLLVQAGFGDRVLLGLDLSRRKYWKSYGGGPGMSYLVSKLVHRLNEGGVSDVAIRQMLISNPAIAFALRTAPAKH